MLITNSQGTSAGVGYNENYPSLLREKLNKNNYELHMLLMSGWSIKNFNVHIDNIISVRPDIVVVQIGIIECAKRILSDNEKRIIKYILLFHSFITNFLHKYRKKVILLRNKLKLNVRKMNLNDFTIELENFYNALQEYNIKLVMVKIPYFDKKYEKDHYPLINEDIEIYNAVIDNYPNFDLIKKNNKFYDIWQSGTVHFTKNGHRLFAKKLYEQLMLFFDNKSIKVKNTCF